MTTISWIPLVGYAAATLAYAIHFVTRGPLAGRVAGALLVGGILVHTFVIGMQTMALGHVPFAGTTPAISMFVWLLALSYLYVELTTEERGMGVFILPLLTALATIPAFTHDPVERAAVLESPWFTLHVSSLLFAYASFALASVIGITYVLLFKEIKAKHLGVFYQRLPSLQALDQMNSRAVTIGWIFLTIGVVVGAVWAAQARQAGFADPRVQAMSLLDPKIFIALLSWTIYSFELYAVRAIGWRGRRAAWLSAVGFVIVLLNFVPVSYFLTKSHNF
jgi:ABC-type transport system involved in cytochrome c biogenesis permease subunit